MVGDDAFAWPVACAVAVASALVGVGDAASKSSGIGNGGAASSELLSRRMSACPAPPTTPTTPLGGAASESALRLPKLRNDDDDAACTDAGGDRTAPLAAPRVRPNKAGEQAAAAENCADKKPLDAVTPACDSELSAVEGLPPNIDGGGAGTANPVKVALLLGTLGGAPSNDE